MSFGTSLSVRFGSKIGQRPFFHTYIFDFCFYAGSILINTTGNDNKKSQ